MRCLWYIDAFTSLDVMFYISGIDFKKILADAHKYHPKPDPSMLRRIQDPFTGIQQATEMTCSPHKPTFVGTLPHPEERLLLNRFASVGLFLDKARGKY